MKYTPTNDKPYKGSSVEKETFANNFCPLPLRGEKSVAEKLAYYFANFKTQSQ